MLQFLIALIIIGAALYLLNLVPIDGTIKTIIRVVVIVALLIWALKFLLPMAGLG